MGTPGRDSEALSIGLFYLGVPNCTEKWWPLSKAALGLAIQDLLVGVSDKELGICPYRKISILKIICSF